MQTTTCPSCQSQVELNQKTCGHCGWQFSRQTISATRPHVTAHTLTRGVVRPNWIHSNSCQLAVLVRDRSGSMEGEKALDASKASRDLVNALADPFNKDGFSVGVIDFSSFAEIIHPAVKASALAGRMTELKSTGKRTNVTGGLLKAEEIVTGYQTPDARKPLRSVVVLFTDGIHNEGAEPGPVADRLRIHADLVCIAFGEGAADDDLRSWASPDLFTRCTDGKELRQFFAKVGATLQETRARGTDATYALAKITES